MRVACVNQDPGIHPGKKKGAAVHVNAMRSAFERLGSEVLGIDEASDDALRARLLAEHRQAPLGLLYERYALGKSAAARFAEEHGLPRILEVNAPLALEAQTHRGRAISDEDLFEDRLAFDSATRIFAVSRAVADYAVERGADAARVEVVPNGIDTELFHPRPKDAAKRQLEIDPARFVVGFHGRLRPWHGFERVVEILAQLLQAGAEVHLVTAGEGPYAELAAALPEERRTHLAWVEHAHMGEVVAAFDAVVLPYDPAQPCYFSPLKLAEAMACGAVPVVAGLGDLPHAVRHGEDGFVLPAGDLTGFAAALEELVRDPSLHSRLGRAAAERVRGQTWTSIAKRALECVVGAF